MNNFKNILIACAASLTLVSATANAGSGTKVPKEIKKLRAMVGHWRGTASLKMGGQSARLTMSINCKVASGGYGISCKSRFAGAGMVQHETDLFGYDAGAGKYHWFAVTSSGETHDHVADRPAGNTFYWVYRGTQGGKRFVERIKMDIRKRGKQMKFTSRMTLGGKPMATMSGTAHKR